MALRTVLSQGGYSVGNGVFEANVILANGDITTSTITSTVAFIGSLTGNASGSAATVTTAAQPNITSVGSLTGLTISNATGIVNFTTSANVTLGAVANLHISGGTANYVLQTDGAGILTWVAQSGGGNASNIANGNSNVSIATSGGNVTTSVAGNANIIVVTGTGVNVAGTLNTTGNTTFTGANVNLGAVANLHISGGTNGYVLSTDGSGTLSWISAAVTSSGSNIVIDTFSGNGVQTVFTLTNAPTSNNYTLININGVSQLHSAYTVANANVTLSAAPANGATIEVMTFNLGSNNTSNISNGTSNVSIATSGGNVTTSVAGNANIIVVTGTGVNVAGTLNTTGNTTFTGANVNLGAVANLHISGGTANYVLQTDGAGTLTWAAQSGGGNASNIANGTSNVSIATSNGNVTTSVAGNANIIVVTGTGVNVAGTLNTTGNLIAGNISASGSGIITGTVDGTDAIGFRNVPINSQSAAYTAVLTDSGKVIFHPSTDANARTFTIPANASVAYPLGTAITFINMTAAVVTIAITSDTMYLTSVGTTGSRSLAQYGSATAIKLTSTTWMISGSGLT